MVTHAALLLTALALAAAENDAHRPHYHQGKLTKYEIGPPSIQLSADDEERLLAGETLQQALVQEDGVSRRLLMVKDIKAPPSIVTGRIVDIDGYPRMVKGCDRTSTYEVSTAARPGCQTVKTRYDIHALHMKFTYYMVHHYDPDARCMVFQLDYDRRSDLDDSVGYWYIQPRGPEVRCDVPAPTVHTGHAHEKHTLTRCPALAPLPQECRVYYSCATRLRTWVPGPVYALMTKQALRQATTWLDIESVKAWQAEQARRAARHSMREAPGIWARRLRERASKRANEARHRWARQGA